MFDQSRWLSLTTFCGNLQMRLISYCVYLSWYMFLQFKFIDSGLPNKIFLKFSIERYFWATLNKKNIGQICFEKLNKKTLFNEHFDQCVESSKSKKNQNITDDKIEIKINCDHFPRNHWVCVLLLEQAFRKVPVSLLYEALEEECICSSLFYFS